MKNKLKKKKKFKKKFKKFKKIENKFVKKIETNLKTQFWKEENIKKLVCKKIIKIDLKNI